MCGALEGGVAMRARRPDSVSLATVLAVLERLRQVGATSPSDMLLVYITHKPRSPTPATTNAGERQPAANKNATLTQLQAAGCEGDSRRILARRDCKPVISTSHRLKRHARQRCTFREAETHRCHGPRGALDGRRPPRSWAANGHREIMIGVKHRTLTGVSTSAPWQRTTRAELVHAAMEEHPS